MAAAGLEDGDRQLLLQRPDVAVHGAGRHPGQARDLADRHATLAAPLRVQDRGDAQQPRQPVALAADPVVAALVIPSVPLVAIGHGFDPVAAGRDGSDDQSLHDPSYEPRAVDPGQLERQQVVGGAQAGSTVGGDRTPPRPRATRSAHAAHRLPGIGRQDRGSPTRARCGHRECVRLAGRSARSRPGSARRPARRAGGGRPPADRRPPWHRGCRRARRPASTWPAGGPTRRWSGAGRHRSMHRSPRPAPRRRDRGRSGGRATRGGLRCCRRRRRRRPRGARRRCPGSQCLRQPCRRRDRVAARALPGCAELAVGVEEDRAGNVARPVPLAAGRAGQRPADIGDSEAWIGAVGRQPVDADERARQAQHATDSSPMRGSA